MILMDFLVIKRYLLSPVTYFFIIAIPFLPLVNSFLEFNEYFDWGPITSIGIEVYGFNIYNDNTMTSDLL